MISHTDSKCRTWHSLTLSHLLHLFSLINKKMNKIFSKLIIVVILFAIVVIKYYYEILLIIDYFNCYY